MTATVRAEPEPVTERSVAPSVGRQLVRRVGGFVGLPLLSALAPFLVLPLLARIAGVEGWAALGVGQAVGAVGATAVILGWSITGPAAVARTEGEVDRATLYTDSLVSRVAMSVFVLPLGVLAAVLLAPAGATGIAAATSVAFGIGGLSPAWYGIGIGRASLLARYEVLPRAVAILLSAPLLLLTREVILYPVLLTTATIVGVTAFSIRHAPAGVVRRYGVRRVAGLLWGSRSGAATVILAGLYSSTPVAIMGALLETGPLAGFSSIDRLYRIAMYAVIAVGNGFQGWVAERRGLSTRSRMRVSLVTHAVLGVLGFAGLAVLGPTITSVAFGAAVAAEPWSAVWYGAAFLGVSLTTSMGLHMLVPLGRTRAVLLSTAVGAVIGVGAMIVLGSRYGGAGGAAGLAIGEGVVTVVQAIALLRGRGRGPTT